MAGQSSPTFATATASTGQGARSAIIGMGFIGRVHAKAVQAAGGRVVAVVDANPMSIGPLAASLHGARLGQTIDDVVESDDVEVVHICTPNYVHAEQVRRVLAAGKHVICEKPLATSLADARGLAAEANSAGVVAAVPFAYRYYPLVRQARAHVAAEGADRVRLIHGSYLQDWLSTAADQNWRVDPRLGGSSRAFGDIGVHWCDLVEFVTGHRIVALAARLSTAVRDRSGPGGTEDAAVLVFETDQGAVGSLVVSQVTPGRKNRLWFSVDGAETSLAFDQEHPEQLWVGHRDGARIVQRGVGSLVDDASRLSVLPAGHPQGYQDCFNGFVGDVYAAIGGGAPVGLPTFDDGARAAQLTHAVLESSRQNTWVEL